MKKKIIGFCVTTLLAVTALTGSAFGANLGGATVNTDLRLRSGPGTEHTTVAVAQKDEAVIVKAPAVNGWYQVIYRGTEGYMSGKYLTLHDKVNADFGMGTIQGTQVRFRKGAGVNTAVLGSFQPGDTMSVLGVDGCWYRVVFRGMEGYVHSDYLSISRSGGAAGETIGIITGTDVRFRAGAGTNYKILGVFPQGASTTVLGTVGEWYQVRYNGTVGYVHSAYLTIAGNSSSQTTASALISTAKQYLGVPYVYGGSTPSGFDCSGFMQYIFGQHGITVSRTAALQYSDNGIPVSKADLQPGDLVFFSSNQKAVGHVGLYIGDQQMIHASSGAGKVIISNITSNYYVNHYVGAKRVL